MDVLYIFGTGSKHDDNELKYSLRSLEDVYPELDRVVVVGASPRWKMQNVTFIPADDPFGESWSENTLYKMLTAIWSNELSKRFVLMNDDFFFLRRELPFQFFYQHALSSRVKLLKDNLTHYAEAARNTLALLQEQGIQNPFSFAMHRPVVYSKGAARELLQQWDRPMMWNTVYCNLLGVQPTHGANAKINQADDFMLATQSWPIVSCNDVVFGNPRVQKWLTTRFPNPSKYELTP